MDLTQIEPRPASELCVRCGVCCVVLKAYCTPDEATALAQHADVALARIVEPPRDGNCLMKFPCTFLRGRVMSHVACSVYGGPRPPVCGSYLCKMAINYVTRKISLEDAIHALNYAFLRGDFGVFNWTGADREVSIYLRGRIVKEAAAMRAEGIPQAVIDYRAAAGVTPHYFIPTEVDHDLISMHFFSHDHRMKLLDAAGSESDRIDVMKAGLGLYFESELIESLPDDGIRIAATAMTAVLNELRGLVVTQRDDDFEVRCGIPKKTDEGVGRGEAVGEAEGEAVGQAGQEALGRSLAHEPCRAPELNEAAAEQLAIDLGHRCDGETVEEAGRLTDCEE